MESQNGAAPDGAGAFGGMAFYNDAAPLALGMGAFRSSLPSFASVKSSQSGPRQEFEQKVTKATKERHEEQKTLRFLRLLRYLLSKIIAMNYAP